MSLFTSKSKTASTGTAAPTNPKPITEGIIDFTKLIGNLGNQDPRRYVTGPTGLQQAAFGMGAGIAQRYGIGLPQNQAVGVNAQMGRPEINRSPNTAASMYDSPGVTTSAQISGGQQGGQQGGQSLYGQAGIAPRQEMDYSGYVDRNPDIAQHYRANVVTPKMQAQLRAVGADYDNDGVISQEEFGRYHYEAHGKGEGRQLTPFGGGQAGGQPGGMVAGGDGSYRPMPGGEAGPIRSDATTGYATAVMPNNPQEVLGRAAQMTQMAGMAGPNLAQMGQLGPASGYGASPQALAAGFTASGPAGAQGYDAAQAAAQGYNAAGAADVGGYNASRASAQGYNAQDAGSRGYDAATISDLERVQMGPVSRASAGRGIQYSQPYENRYTDQVVDTTLANMDEMAGRQRAAEAAAAARNSAFGGSRFGIQRALTEENLFRERASQEAGLRFGAQDRAFGLGMQDAGMATQVSQANAAAANQQAQAQAMMDQQRLMANMDARNQAGQFGAAAGNQAALVNAAARNQASQFGAGAQNQASMFNAQAADAAGQFGAQARNMAQMDAVGRQDAAGQFGAQASNVAGLSNQAAINQARALQAEAANRASLDFAGRSDAAGQFGADAFNRSALDFAGRQDTSGQFNAGAMNQFDLSRFGAANNMAQFNAGQGDAALNRQLGAAGQLGQLGGAMGAQERADMQMLSALGADERAINQQQATADIQLMNMMAQLYGQMPYNLFTGQNTTGTTTQRNTPSTMSAIQQTLDVGKSLAGMFGGMPTGETPGTVTGPNTYVGGTFTEGWT